MRIHRVSQGDGAALRDLLDQYEPMLQHLYGRSSSTSFREFFDFDDFTQEVAIRLWKSAKKYDSSKSSETSWIHMIAQRTLIDACRSFKHRMRWVAPSAGVYLAETPERQESTEKSYREILSSVSSKYREFLDLKARGMSDSKLAEMYNVPMATMKSRLKRVRDEAQKRALLAQGSR
jgi:RNA polymerase sigma-70 factor (ECF subfamily)